MKEISNADIYVNISVEMVAGWTRWPNAILSRFYRVRSGYCERASGLVDYLPGWALILKLKQPRVSVQRYCFWISCFAVMKLSISRTSIIIASDAGIQGDLR